MNISAGHKLRNEVLNDSKLLNHFTDETLTISADPTKEGYRGNDQILTVTTLTHRVETVGEIAYGIRIEIPETADPNQLADYLTTLTQDCLEVKPPLIWAEHKFERYRIYVECEDILEQSVHEYSYLDDIQDPSEFYTLQRN